MKLDLIEPLRWLFKDEVRAVGRKLGLPDDMVTASRSQVPVSVCESSAKSHLRKSPLCRKPTGSSALN